MSSSSSTGYSSRNISSKSSCISSRIRIVAVYSVIVVIIVLAVVAGIVIVLIGYPSLLQVLYELSCLTYRDHRRKFLNLSTHDVHIFMLFYF